MSWGTLREGYYWSHLPSRKRPFSALRPSSLQWSQMSANGWKKCSLFPWCLSLDDAIAFSQGKTLFSCTQIKIQTESENLSCLASPVELQLLLDWSTASPCAAEVWRSPVGHIQCSHPPETITASSTFPLGSLGYWMSDFCVWWPTFIPQLPQAPDDQSSSYYVWLLIQTLQTCKECLSRKHSLVWMGEPIVS